MILNELFYFCHEEKVTENILFNNFPNFIIIFLLFSSLYFISLSLSQCFLLFTGVTFLFVYFCLRKKRQNDKNNRTFDWRRSSYIKRTNSVPLTFMLFLYKFCKCLFFLSVWMKLVRETKKFLI